VSLFVFAKNLFRYITMILSKSSLYIVNISKKSKTKIITNNNDSSVTIKEIITTYEHSNVLNYIGIDGYIRSLVYTGICSNSPIVKRITYNIKNDVEKECANKLLQYLKCYYKCSEEIDLINQIGIIIIDW